MLFATQKLTVVTIAFMIMCSAGTPAWSQGFSYTSSTTIEIPGKLGSLLSAAASLTGQNEIEETISILNNKMRVNKGEVSIITDLEWQTVTTIHHPDKSFTVETFDEMLARLESAKNQLEMADFAMEEAGVQVESVQSDVPVQSETKDSSNQGVQFSFETQWSGQKKRLNRLPAEQAYLTLIAESMEGQGDGLAGTFVVFNDIWVTREIDGYHELASFQQQAGELLGSAYMGKGGLEKLQSAILSDARIDAFMESMREESQKIEGIPILTETYLVLVSENNQFERDLIVEDVPKRSGLKGAFSAVRRTLRDGKPTEEDQATQNTLAKITVSLSDFSTHGVSSEDFEPPSGYTELIKTEK